jgi:hypothetical protein
MASPGTRFFIGPLTPAQQRRRLRNRERFRRAAEVADTRNTSIMSGFLISRHEERNFHPMGFGALL